MMQKAHLDFIFCFQTLASLFTFLTGPVSLMFCGHLGREELDGVSLAISVRKYLLTTGKAIHVESVLCPFL